MREQDKIDEAAFFLEEMAQREDRPGAYRYLTSAFLSAARSVLQYVCKEATQRAQGQAWYDSHMPPGSLLSYFRDKRDVNVHQEPVEAARTMTMRHGMRWPADEDEDDVRPPQPFATMTYHYQFEDWPGPEDVPTLCWQYLDELRRVVADGQVKGFVTS
jgi:hypothetical protein